MNFTLSANQGLSMVPINLIFWANIAAYTVHVLEESTLREVFVEKLRKNVWPTYSWKHFFGFNTMLLSLNILAALIYDSLGGAWVIFPMSLLLERCLNGFWHLGETILRRKFSSGLLSSVCTWILTYLVVRYALLKGELDISHFLVAAIVGTCITGLMMGSMYSFRRKYMPALKGSK